ncbi:MAG TPA: hypothetical protein VIL55_09640, partial [Naasia sp.]
SSLAGVVPTILPAPMSSSEMTRRLSMLEHTSAGVAGSEASYARRATFIEHDRQPWGLLVTASALLVVTVAELFVAVLVFS